MSEVAELLRLERERRGWSQQQMARLVSCDRSVIGPQAARRSSTRAPEIVLALGVRAAARVERELYVSVRPAYVERTCRWRPRRTLRALATVTAGVLAAMTAWTAMTLVALRVLAWLRLWP